jgi:hypothetical protein
LLLLQGISSKISRGSCVAAAEARDSAANHASPGFAVPPFTAKILQLLASNFAAPRLQ